MRKYFILFIIFLALLIGQQSHVVEKKKVYDRVLGVYKEEYHWNWNNLISYFEGLKIKAIRVKDKIIRMTPK